MRRLAVLTSLCVLAAIPVTFLASANGTTSYFLVAELPGQELWHDSHILPLTNPTHVAHARSLISDGPGSRPFIVVAEIASGADGINRDYLKDGAPEWSWHVTNFQGFAGFVAEILDGGPTLVENDVEGWIKNTDGMIGFCSYTVVEELPLQPLITNLSWTNDKVTLHAERMSVGFVASVEASTDLSSDVWQEIDSFPILKPQASIVYAVPNSAERLFFRLIIRHYPALSSTALQ